jgi:uncharacterized protein
MSLSLYQSSVPVFERALTALSGVLDKAAAHAATCKFDPAIYLTTRLRPDMFAFSRQVQTACDQAKNGTARLAGAEPPRFDDKEVSLDELSARIKATLAFLKSIDPKAVDASGDREIVFPVGPNKMKMKGADYLLHFVPRLLASSTFAVLVVVATVAPRCFASWIANVPTPPEPA